MILDTTLSSVNFQLLGLSLEAAAHIVVAADLFDC